MRSEQEIRDALAVIDRVRLACIRTQNEGLLIGAIGMGDALAWAVGEGDGRALDFAALVAKCRDTMLRETAHERN